MCVVSIALRSLALRIFFGSGMLGQLALWAKIASSDIPPLSQLTFFFLFPFTFSPVHI